jgi:mono/diheme cytochrome c family protein
LRYASAATHQQFESIVLGGARQQMGMPSFKDALKPDQVKDIEAYILARSAESAK